MLWNYILYFLRALGISEDAQVFLQQIVELFVHHLYHYGKYKGKKAEVRFLLDPHLTAGRILQNFFHLF